MLRVTSSRESAEHIKLFSTKAVLVHLLTLESGDDSADKNFVELGGLS